MRGDLDGILLNQFRDLHRRVRAIEGWISTSGTSSSKASHGSIVDSLGKAGKAVHGLVTIGRIVAIVLLWLWAALGLVWGYVKPWLLGLLWPHG